MTPLELTSALREYIRRYPQALHEDKRVYGWLQDHAPEQKRTAKALQAISELKLYEQLRDCDAMTIERLVQTLYDERAMSKVLATYALEIWLAAQFGQSPPAPLPGGAEPPTPPPTAGGQRTARTWPLLAAALVLAVLALFSWASGPRVADPETLPRGMTLVQGATVEVGCEVTAPGCPEDHTSRNVAVDAFYMDKTEVDVRAYAGCVNAGICTPPIDSDDPRSRKYCSWHSGRGSLPVNCVTHEQARVFCEASGSRLPTEAEWERVARGTHANLYPWGNDVPTCDLAHLAIDGLGCGTGTLAPVNSLLAGGTREGVLHLVGNVAEWVTHDDVEGAIAKGSFFGSRPDLSEPWRRISTTDTRTFDDQAAASAFGFRCARDVN